MQTIYDYIIGEQVVYQKPIDLEDGWSWGMKDHLRRSYLYKNSQFEQENENRTLRPNKNIVLAILNVQYRTEGFDVKDIELFVDDINENYKSFLVKKFHDKWALENQIDTFIDGTVESYCDYGGALVRKSDKAKPEVVDMRSLAFCNQSNILANPFGIRHTFSASQLREMDKWGKDENGATMDIETLIRLVQKEGEDEDDNREIEVFEVHGNMPVEWLDDNTNDSKEDSDKDVSQMQVVAFYQNDEGIAQGVTLFQSKEPTLPFKFLARDEIKDRALGRGGVEELFEAQAWTNWNEIKVTEMLNNASKQINVTDDPLIASKHPSGLKGIDNGEFIEVGQGKSVKSLDNSARNLPLFNDSLERWNNHAQILGSATDPLLGESPSAGTPFKLFEAQQLEAKGMHNYRQGKLAVFIDEIYRDWIIPYIQKEIANEQSFLTELSADEMQDIGTQVAENEANKQRNEQVLNGELPDEKEELKQNFLTRFLEKGSRQFIKIFKDEIKEPLSVMTNIAGKQKNQALITDKMVGVVRQLIASPQVRQDPEMIKWFNNILESSGLSPIMFSPQLQQPQPQQEQGGSTEPLKQLSEAV